MTVTGGFKVLSDLRRHANLLLVDNEGFNARVSLDGERSAPARSGGLVLENAQDKIGDAASDPISDGDPVDVGSERDAGSPVTVRPPPPPNRTHK